RGAAGWQTGYVVPVMGGALAGSLTLGARMLSLEGGVGYHDHNWGFWDGVTWQWGQVQHDDLSFVYGRVHPPADAADPARMPGFLGVLGPQGPLGYASDVSIDETSDPASGRPRQVRVRAPGPSLQLELDLEVEEAVPTSMPAHASAAGMDFLQLRGRYRVTGQVGDRAIAFEAPGAAETFRGNETSSVSEVR